MNIEALTEQREVGDNWRSLEYLTKGLERKSIDSCYFVPIRGTAQQKRYIEYLNKKIHDGQTNLEFLKEDRIELNTIMTEIGAKRFWNWLYAKIVKTFPTRNYNRTISVPPYEITLSVLDNLNSIIAEKIETLISNKVDEIKNKLYRVNGLLITDVKEEEIQETLEDMVNDDEEISGVKKTLKELLNKTLNIEDDSGDEP